MSGLVSGRGELVRHELARREVRRGGEATVSRRGGEASCAARSGRGEARAARRTANSGDEQVKRADMRACEVSWRGELTR